MGKLIHIIFEDFAVEYTKHNCGYDSLTFYDYVDGKRVRARKMCGSTLPEPFTTKSNKMRIEFYSDSGNQDRGFKLSYIVIDAQKPAPPSGRLYPHYMNTLSSKTTTHNFICKIICSNSSFLVEYVIESLRYIF